MRTRLQSKEVGDAYGSLVEEMRKAAGDAIHDAWIEPPSDGDSEMNIPGGLFDTRQLEHAENKFIKAVTKRLDKLSPRGLRQKREAETLTQVAERRDSGKREYTG